jgi:transcriptional regulator with XRE-family HTH domain
MGREKVAAVRQAEDALVVLGQQIRMARRERNITAAELAARIGVSPNTVSAIEKGAPSVTAGNLFNAAALVGVPLFGAQDSAQLAMLRRTGQEKLALIPTRVRHRKEDEDAWRF